MSNTIIFHTFIYSDYYMLNVVIAIAPIIVIGFYFYIRDKYEKEPLWELIKSILSGCIIAFLAIFTGSYLADIGPRDESFNQILFNAFVLAGFNEETWKLLVFILIIWSNKHFNENFDGIVYAVFISLGFAGIENILYVINGGIESGIIRAVTAVPVHAFNGLIMGYFLSLAKFGTARKPLFFLFAWIIPILLHGIWDTLIFSIKEASHLEVPVSIFIWLLVGFAFFIGKLGSIKINEMVEKSQFKKNPSNKIK